MTISPKSKIVLLVIVFASAILALIRINTFQVGAYFDDAHYIILSRSLINSHEFRLLNFPNTPLEQAFPPGFPLMLVPLDIVFPGSLNALKLVPLACWLLSIVLAYRLLSRILPSPYLEMVIALFALNPAMIGLSGMVMSELPYTCFSLLALLLFDIWSHTTNFKYHLKYGLLATVILSVLCALLIRTVGMVLLIAILSELLLARRIRPFIAALCFSIIAYFVQSRLNVYFMGSAISPFYSSLLSYGPAEKLHQIFSNLGGYIFTPTATLSNMVIPILGPNTEAVFSRLGLNALYFLIALIVPTIILVGYIASFRKLRPVALYVLFYSGAILAFWKEGRATNADARYLIPILPFIYLYFFEGLRTIIQAITAIPRRRTVQILAALSAVAVIALLARNVQDWQNPIRNRFPDLSAGSDWIKSNVPSDEIIMSPNAAGNYLYYDRKTVEYPALDQNLWTEIKRWDVDYVVVSENVGSDATLPTEMMLTSLRNQPALAQEVYRDDSKNIILFHIKKSQIG